MIQFIPLLSKFGGWFGAHKLLTGSTIVLLLFALGGAATYIYIQNLQSQVASLEVKLDRSQNFITQLTGDIEFQNEAITDMRKEAADIREEARRRIDKEIERQRELDAEFKPSKTTEDLNQWLDSL